MNRQVIFSVYSSVQKKLFKTPDNATLAWDLGYRVNFTDFVTWLVERRNYLKDEHFAPAVYNCPPCSTAGYDFVGHVESFSSDIKVVLNYLIILRIL